MIYGRGAVFYGQIYGSADKRSGRKTRARRRTATATTGEMRARREGRSPMQLAAGSLPLLATTQRRVALRCSPRPHRFSRWLRQMLTRLSRPSVALHVTDVHLRISTCTCASCPQRQWMFSSLHGCSSSPSFLPFFLSFSSLMHRHGGFLSHLRLSIAPAMIPQHLRDAF